MWCPGALGKCKINVLIIKDNIVMSRVAFRATDYNG